MFSNAKGSFKKLTRSVYSPSLYLNVNNYKKVHNNNNNNYNYNCILCNTTINNNNICNMHNIKNIYY